MIILGIDPGFADMGYGVVSVEDGGERCVAYGSLRTSPALALPERLGELYGKLAAVIEKFRPDEAAVERLFFSKNAKTAMQVAEARGVIMLCLVQAGVRCREFGPADVKIAVCGHGGAAKREVQKMAKMLLGLDAVPEPDDAADAVALALAAAHTKVMDVR